MRATVDRLALTNCGAVLTNDGPHRDGATVLFSGGRIAAVTSEPPPEGFEAIDVEGRAVTPGLVDAHTHAVFAGDRSSECELRAQGASYQDIASAGGGIMSTVRAVRELNGDELFDVCRRHLSLMLASGTTTAEVKSGYGLVPLQELKMLEVARRLGRETPVEVVTTFLGAHAVPQEFKGDKAGYMRLVLDEMLPLVIDTQTADAVDIFVEEGFFDAEDARALARAADLPLRMHVDQFSNGGAELAVELGAVTADHLEQTGADGIRALAQSGTIPVLLPASVLCLGLQKYPDARRMLDAGLPVVLATDFNPGSSPTPSLPFVMSLACHQMGMTPLEALAGCTVNAAKALGLPAVGSLVPGAQADVVVWNVERLQEIPYYAGAPLVWAVYKHGERVV